MTDRARWPTLADVERRLQDAERRGDAALVDVTHDSRQVRPGWLFCCVPGSRVDGHDHASEAVAGGAAALLVERFLDGLDVPQLRVPGVRDVLGPVAALLHGDPSHELTVVGVTGTNGKTTTTYLLEHAFGAAGLGTGVVGTVEARVHGAPQPGVRTTPEGPDLQRLLAGMHARGVDTVAMEVSSHGLDLRRVDGTRFAVAVFTNLSQDHLDHHGSMEAYFAAKRRLFTPALAELGVVCVDDPWGWRLARESEVPVRTFGTHDDAEHRLVEVDAGLGGTRVVLAGPEGRARLVTPLLGTFNARNAAAAYLAAVAAGVAPDAARVGVAACRRVPGRLEPVDVGQPFAVLVDYAHTPAALEEVVRVARELARPAGRVTVVVGCGGDRDPAKRPAMGAVAATADRAVLTSDNPRSEDPAAILDAVRRGAEAAVADGDGDAEVVGELDRARAIRAAMSGAEAGDVVVVAGKGHETGQELADRRVPFDDRTVAVDVLASLGFGGVRAQAGGAA